MCMVEKALLTPSAVYFGTDGGVKRLELRLELPGTAQGSVVELLDGASLPQQGHRPPLAWAAK
jgi:TctA family transporter